MQPHLWSCFEPTLVVSVPTDSEAQVAQPGTGIAYQRSLERPPWPPTLAGYRALGVASCEFRLVRLSETCKRVNDSQRAQLNLELDRILATHATLGELQAFVAVVPFPKAPPPELPAPTTPEELLPAVWDPYLEESPRQS